MKFLIATLCLTIISFNILDGQTKAELEERRKAALNEINYVDNMLKTTSRKKEEGINAIKIIGKKVKLRESIIEGMREEINLLIERIEINNLAIDMMEKDLIDLKRDYKNAVINSYITKNQNPELIFVFSARDFNQGYKRLKYLQHITKYRRNESEIIMELKAQVQATREKQQRDLYRLSDLKSGEEKQKGLLLSEQVKRREMVKSFSKKEKQLQKELEEKKRVARKIESEIVRIMEEERKKTVKSGSTPEQKLIGDNFAENKGRLPWPVEKGIITSQFGLQNHPVLKYVTESNPGIEITSLGRTSVRSVFKGEVAKVFPIPGANMTLIIRHGKYLTVYNNIVDLKVKTGDKVETKQTLGYVYCDESNGSKSMLKFMIFEEKEKLDPEQWISKK